MKALTIKQPWASLIANGIKDVENRTWRTKYRGRIYIHAAGCPAKGFLSLLNKDQVNDLQSKTDLSFDFPYSAIIGEVDIVDCVVHHPSIWAEKSWIANNIGLVDGEGEKDHIIYKWVLANPVLYEVPILNVKGKLSFWEFNKEERP